jgi:multimeric flavodoxin WrbA
MVEIDRAIQVIGFAGSPRIGGNTDTLLDEVLRGAVEAGATAEKTQLSRLVIGPCLACDACVKTGVCVQRDDMQELVEKMKRGDIWVLATPIYWWGPSAQLKAFVDRWYGPWHSAEVRELFARKRAILVASMGDSKVQTARHVVGMLSDAFKFLDMQLADTVLAAGVHARGDAADDPALLAAAFSAGKKAVIGS